MQHHLGGGGSLLDKNRVMDELQHKFKPLFVDVEEQVQVDHLYKQSFVRKLDTIETFRKRKLLAQSKEEEDEETLKSFMESTCPPSSSASLISATEGKKASTKVVRKKVVVPNVVIIE